MPAPPTVTNAPTPPDTPADGDLWFNVLTGREYVWYIGPSGVGTWVQTQPSSSALVTARTVPGTVPQPPTATPRDVIRVPEITVSPVPPVNPLVGDLWWSPITGMECVWYDDGNTKQWVQTQPVKYINIATLAGVAGGDLTGTYPNPQIIPGIELEAPKVALLPDPTINDLELVPAQWVNQRLAGLTGLPIPPQSVAYGAADGSLTGDETLLSFDDVAKLLTVAGGNVAISTLPPGTNDNRGASTGFVHAAITALPAPPTTLPPSGPAGGALAGTYPNPSLAVPYPTTLPPSGSAGGALAGTYPNPSLAVPYPTTLPPNGPAGGDLSGNYPNPTLKPSATNGQVMTTVAGVATWAAPSGGGASISIGTTPPGSPAVGALWWQSELGQLFIYYNDGNSTQWVPASASAGGASAGMPPGSVTDFAGTTVPSGWYLCDGSLKNRVTDAPLFAAISTTFGAGDGSTTFALPDLRGRVTAGLDPGGTAGRVTSGVSGIAGQTLGAVGGDQSLQSHTHGTPGGNVADQNGNRGRFAFSDGTAASDVVSRGTGGGNSQNMPPTMIINKIIKA